MIELCQACNALLDFGMCLCPEGLPVGPLVPAPRCSACGRYGCICPPAATSGYAGAVSEVPGQGACSTVGESPVTGFKLDTSGAIWVDPIECPGIGWIWRDLDPFTQGYIEALFADPLTLPFGDRAHANWLKVGFSDLAPDTLAAILKDCEALPLAGPRTREQGGRFWRERNSGWPNWWTEATPHAVASKAAFPPLTAYLGDEGSIYLRSAA